ncbi:MAG: ChaN family lipoprotein [Planctomycetes bacterium]|nr:ChaN family lipoprotein [Planctomycetota bacterium]
MPWIMHLARTCVTSALVLFAACAAAPEPAARSATGATYREAFAAAAGSRIVRTLDRAAFAGELRQVRVLWLGDQHGSSRVHGLQSQLLEELRRRGIPMLLVLECLGTQDEPLVQDYLAGNIDLLQLRRAVRERWSGSWLDDPELDPFFYRTLLSFAARQGIPVRALEPVPRAPLAGRDAAIAERVADIAEAHGDRLVVVLVGQAHLLGQGDLVHRTNQPCLAVGAEPPAALRGTAPADGPRDLLLQSDSGLFWFGELCRETR